MASINIPEPCHENWADFTPTQKGAFCGSCAIDVYDFSNKTPDEIKSILKENQGKHLCGRFRKSQLDDLNSEFTNWQKESPKTFQSKFLYACLIVFGMSLFTSCNVSEKNFLSGIGIEWKHNENEAHLNLLKPAADNDTDTNKVNKNQFRKGKVKYEPEQMMLGQPAIIMNEENESEPDSLDKGTIIEQNNVMIQGNIVCNVNLLSELETPEDTLGENYVLGDTLYSDQMVDGGLAWTPEFEEFIDDTVSTETTEQIQEIEEIHVKGEIAYIAPETEQNYPTESTVDSANSEAVVMHVPGFDMVFEAMLYPNPVQDQTTVVINVKDAQMFTVYLYAINGKMVKDIYKGMLATGRQEFLIDLSQYEAGSYLIVINSEKQKESLRLEKLH